MNIYMFNKLFINNRPLDKVVVTFIINVCMYVLTLRSWCIYYVLEYVYCIFAGCDVNVLYTIHRSTLKP